MQLAPDIQMLLFLPETLPCSQPASSFDLPLFLFPSGVWRSAVLVKLGDKRITVPSQRHMFVSLLLAFY